MCFSARVKQDLQDLARRFGAEIAWEMFADVFRRRLEGDRAMKVSVGLENNFSHPKSPIEEQIWADILAYRHTRTQTLQAEIFQQKKRLADAERALSVKETKTARESARIAKNKIEERLSRLEELKHPELSGRDGRIFPMMIAPVIATLDGRRQLIPMRYHCRQAGKPASVDRQYDGLYNARRDNLRGYWKALFARQHALMVVSEFWENVKVHDYEHRVLAPGEKETNLVLHFNPNPPIEMLVACLWDRWQAPGQPNLYSFAAITDEPPAEIAATGHNRCIIALREANLPEWLSPTSLSPGRLDEILSEKEKPYYEHRIAA